MCVCVLGGGSTRACVYILCFHAHILIFSFFFKQIDITKGIHYWRFKSFMFI